MVLEGPLKCINSQVVGKGWSPTNDMSGEEQGLLLHALTES